jgi:nitrous oxidase accessory protein NosD
MTGIVRRRAALGASGALALSGLFALSGVPASASGGALWVSPTGHDSLTCTHASPCLTIEHAVHLAPSGGTVKVEAGTYAEGVIIRKPLTLIGLGNPTVDATTSVTGNGILLAGPGASHSTVSGFTVMNAEFEGILAIGAPPTSGPVGKPITHVVISGNTVENNDTGFAAQAAGECIAPAPNIPGDCGEGLHLFTATWSLVTNNIVKDNAGGILLTDEFGPNHNNTVSNNVSLDNQFDCGITVVSHSSNAVAMTGPNAGHVQPAMGGTYNNLIVGNTVDGNGNQGEGGGVLLAAAGPGGAVYNNIVRDNTAVGNGLGGVVIHSHFGFQDLNGNVIEGNHLSNDNLAGDKSDFLINNVVPTAIQIGSGLGPGVVGPPPPSPITGTIIRNNFISDVHDGIWTLNSPLSPNVVSQNTFGPNVTTPLEAH